MKFANVEGQRHDAQPGLTGECPVCGAAVIAKCGEIRVWHWSHYRKPDCDPWWENETPWHRAWKNRFPSDWQEAIHYAENGERHRADVKTDHGQVIEFQHSNISPEERRSREAFYGQLVWVVNGLRRQRDLEKFQEAINFGNILRVRPLIISVPTDACALLRDWCNSSVPAFLDCGTNHRCPALLRTKEPILWHLSPKSLNGTAYLSAVRRGEFIRSLLDGTPLKWANASIAVEQFVVAKFSNRTRKQAKRGARAHSGRPVRRRDRCKKYMERKRRARSQTRY
jgi:hypothetical protein